MQNGRKDEAIKGTWGAKEVIRESLDSVLSIFQSSRKHKIIWGGELGLICSLEEKTAHFLKENSGQYVVNFRVFPYIIPLIKRCGA